jgi:predicted transcriptional regulator YdeE
VRLLTVLALFTASLQCQQAIQIKKVEQFYVLGMSVRTDNAHEMTGQGKIGGLWLGWRVPSEEMRALNQLPPGLTAIKIQAGKYAIIPSERGPAAKVVPEVWKRIWALTPTELTRPRAFKTDFELYGSATTNDQVDVFIGLR